MKKKKAKAKRLRSRHIAPVADGKSTPRPARQLTASEAARLRRGKGIN